MNRCIVYVLFFLCMALIIPYSSALEVQFVDDKKGTVVQTEEPFKLSIDESTLRHGWITKEDTQVYAVYVEGLFETWDGAIPPAMKYFGITFGEKATAGSYIKYRKVGNTIWNVLDANDFSYKTEYILDSGKIFEDVYYTSFATIPAGYSSEFIIYAELKDKPKRSDFAIYFGTGSTVLTVDISNDLVVTSNYSAATYYNATIDVSAGLLIFNSTYENSTYQISGSAITYDVISNTNTSLVIAIPETRSNFSFNPTNIIENQTTIRFNTTDASWFGQETVTATQAYLSEPNLTRIRVSFPSILNKYDLFSSNLTSYLGWNPANIQNVWYDTFSGNTNNNTLKNPNDYASWQDTCSYGNTTGMVLCMPFEEGQGITAKDRANNSQNNNDGTLTNMNLGIDNGTSGWTSSGKFGNGIMFDSVNDYVTAGNPSIFNFTQYSAFSVSTWINVKNFGAANWANVVSKGDYNGWGIRVRSDEYFSGDVKTSSEVDLLSSSSLATNIWYLITMTAVSGGNVSLYKNGILDVTGALAAGAFAYTTNTMNVGFGQANYFNGTIDEVRIYNRALSAAEILDLYNMKKDYFDSMYNEEGTELTALSEWDMIVQNGTVSSCALPNVTTAINADWNIKDVCVKDATNINLGTGSMIINATAGGRLVLTNLATIFLNKIIQLGSGEHIHIFSGDIVVA